MGFARLPSACSSRVFVARGACVLASLTATAGVDGPCAACLVAAMAYLDALLPEITTATLSALVARDERPTEGTYYEFKSEFTARHVAKTVSAFANTDGGFLIFGAQAKGRILE